MAVAVRFMDHSSWFMAGDGEVLVAVRAKNQESRVEKEEFNAS